MICLECSDTMVTREEGNKINGDELATTTTEQSADEDLMVERSTL